jgi:hypothetical protein
MAGRKAVTGAAAVKSEFEAMADKAVTFAGRIEREVLRRYYERYKETELIHFLKIDNKHDEIALHICLCCTPEPVIKFKNHQLVGEAYFLDDDSNEIHTSGFFAGLGTLEECMDKAAAFLLSENNFNNEYPSWRYTPGKAVA